MDKNFEVNYDTNEVLEVSEIKTAKQTAIAKKGVPDKIYNPVTQKIEDRAVESEPPQKSLEERLESLEQKIDQIIAAEEAKQEQK